MLKLPLFLVALTTLVGAAEPLWHNPVRPTANVHTSQSMDFYRVQGEIVTQLSGYIRGNQIHVSENGALAFGPQTRFVEDEDLARYDGPRGTQRGYCRSTYARTFREGQVLVLQTWTHEKSVMVGCPWTKSERSRMSGANGPIMQRYYRFVDDGAGGMNLSFTMLDVRSASAGFAPGPFRPMVRLER